MLGNYPEPEGMKGLEKTCVISLRINKYHSLFIKAISKSRPQCLLGCCFAHGDIPIEDMHMWYT